MCQCPRTGNLHFYEMYSDDDSVLLSVSMPSYGQLTFLLYPLKRPYFIRISDSDFAGNSQKILKTRLFIRFTCMFTVCSYLRFLWNLTLTTLHNFIISYFSQKHLSRSCDVSVISQHLINRTTLSITLVCHSGERYSPLS